MDALTQDLIMSGSDTSPPTYKQRDAESYDAVAAEFDHFAQRLTVPFVAKMLALAQLRPRDRVLDVGTGTGLVALGAAPLAGEGKIIGIDHSQGMLEQAAAKARQAGVGDVVSFRKMDAEQLEFCDGSFDVILSLFALLHFPEPLRALQQMHRVLRPGGRVVIGVGSGPSLCSWNGVVQGVRRTAEFVAAARGRMLTAPQFLHRMLIEHGMTPDARHQPLDRRPRIRRLLRKAGFERIQRHWLGHRTALDPDEFWRLQVTFSSPDRIRLREASVRDVAALKQDFLERCRTVQNNGGELIYRHAAMFYVGMRA